MTDKLKVTQADRERAAEIFGAYESMAMRKKCLDGKLDMHPTTEAFARHRFAAEQSRDDVIEECVKVVEEYGPNPVHGNASSQIVERLRNLKGKKS